jgi:hypothetical protein
MELTDSDIRDFAKIWADEFRETVTDEEARMSAAMLLDLYLLLTTAGLEDETS